MSVSGLYEEDDSITTGEDSDAFKNHVLAWLRRELEEGNIHIYDYSVYPPVPNRHGAIKVLSVSGYGSDWAGDTAGGFYSETSIDIRWVDAARKEHFTELKGELFSSLWHWVVSAWKDQT
jgi:hypothetical protein